MPARVGDSIVSGMRLGRKAVGEFEFSDEFRRRQAYRDCWAQPGLTEFALMPMGALLDQDSLR